MGDAGYVVEEHWHSKPRHVRVISIGAGASGLMVAYKLKKECQNYDLVLYEKNPEVGGTWFENRYPGCACDVPAHVYTYPFEPNPDWSEFYAGSQEIQQYFVDFAKKHDLNKYVQFNSVVQSVTWIEDQGIYDVEISCQGKIVHDFCHILINATGTLNKWKWPDIPGLNDFQGKLLHSAHWDSSLSWQDKTVAVIGTGSSAIQILPQIQPTAKGIVTFMRSVTWISPPIAEDMLKQAEADTGNLEGKLSSPSQHKYTEEEKRRFREHPEEHLAYRKELECRFNGMFDLFLAGSEVSKSAQEGMRQEMMRRIGPGNEDLKKRLIPRWPPGCRRLTPGEGYLEALVKDNVTRVHDEISHINAEGLVDVTRKLHKVDIIVAATGFDVTFKPSFKAFGVNGVDMHQEFEPLPKVYLSMAVAKFPNYFTINGFRGSWAAGTALNSHEACVNYIVQCMHRIQNENIRALEIRPEPIEDLYEHIEEWHKRTVWNADCTSWFKSKAPGKKLIMWGGSNLHYLKSLEFVRWEHYEFRYHARNTWAFLGNGQVKAEISKEVARLTPYIRNSDEPWKID